MLRRRSCESSECCLVLACLLDRFERIRSSVLLRRLADRGSSAGARPPARSRCPTRRWSMLGFRRSRLLAGPEIWRPTTQTGCGTNYWSPSTPYVSAQVSNPPPACDIVSLIGGVNQTYIVTLSEAIKDPIMAVLSLGQPSVFTTYDFDAPFDIVSQGTGFWGGNASSLVELPGDILQGNEGHGTHPVHRNVQHVLVGCSNAGKLARLHLRHPHDRTDRTGSDRGS